MDVDIGKDHGAFMTSSRSPERLRSIPGRMPPVAFDTGNSTRFCRIVFGFDRISANPSSTSDVSVRPSSAACFFSPLQEIVVYSNSGSHTSMHNTDASICQAVKKVLNPFCENASGN